MALYQNALLKKERPEGDKSLYRPLVARIINKGEKI